MRAKRRMRYLSLVSVIVLLMNVLAPINSAWAAISWSTKAPMPTARIFHKAESVNGKIYAIGGQTGWDSSYAVPMVEEYDPLTNVWITKTPVPSPRAAFGIAVVNDKIYILGGWTAPWPVNTVQEYNPATDSWSTKTPIPMVTTAATAAAVNNKIYLLGGSGPDGVPVNTVREYDPVTDSWATKAPMPTARRWLTAAVVNNKIYTIGGGTAPNDTPTNVVEEYDPATNTWATKSPLPTADLMAAVAAVTVNGKIYAMRDATPVYKYDPTTNSWSSESPMSVGHYGGAAVAIGNKIYVLGGNWGFTIHGITEEGVIPVQAESTVQVQATVNPTIQLTVNPTTLNFGNVNPAVGSYTQTKNATVSSNRPWNLYVRKTRDLTGTNPSNVIPSSQLTFTSPAQQNPVQFQLTDTLVNSGSETSGTLTNINYNLQVTWYDKPDSYSAEHIYTAIQP